MANELAVIAMKITNRERGIESLERELEQRRQIVADLKIERARLEAEKDA